MQRAAATESSHTTTSRGVAARLARALFWAAIAALPVSSAGCQSTACFVWSAAEGPCPSRVAAASFFGVDSCGSEVQSVDGDGHFDGQLCCYSVTELSSDPERFDGCLEEEQFSGAGGFGGSFGSAGGGGFCITCSEALDGGDPLDLCSFSISFFDNLTKCMCMGACSVSCGDDFCQGFAPSRDCSICIQDSSPNGCGFELDDCLNDF